MRGETELEEILLKRAAIVTGLFHENKTMLNPQKGNEALSEKHCSLSHNGWD
jgi:hypothetical protein